MLDYKIGSPDMEVYLVNAKMFPEYAWDISNSGLPTRTFVLQDYYMFPFVWIVHLRCLFTTRYTLFMNISD